MTSATAVSAALRDHQTYNYSQSLVYVLRRFGISEHGINILYGGSPVAPLQSGDAQSNFSRDATFGKTEDILKRQLNPGKLYSNLESTFLEGIEHRMRWNNIYPGSLLPSNDPKGLQRTVSLTEFVRRTVVESTTVAFLGPAIFRVDPKIVDTFIHFDQNVWVFLYNIPRPWSNSVFASMEKLCHSMEMYLQLPNDQRPGAAWIATAIEAEHKAAGISIRDIARCLAMIYWT